MVREWVRVKCKLSGDGSFENPFRVRLPTYQVDYERDEAGKVVLNEEGFPKPAIDYKAKLCWVLMLKDEVDEEGLPNEKVIRRKYGGRWAKFKREWVIP